MVLHPRRLLGPLAPLAIAALLAGCGKSAPQTVPGGGPLRRLAPVEAEGAVSVATRNTTRVGGASAVVDAASVARVVYPGLTSGSRPQAVVIVDVRNWPAALAAAALAGAPLDAPLLYAVGNSLPAVSLQALEAMRPRGAAALGGAQVIRIGTEAPIPPRFAVHQVAAGTPAATALAIERLQASARAGQPGQVIVMRSSGPRALEMPAAGLAAESGAPILFAEGPRLGAVTGAALKAMHRPSIYVINPGTLGAPALGALASLGRVTRVSAGGGGSGPAANAISLARYTDGSFGWGIKEPGHGLVFANPARPMDAPAAAPLSASADYGPLLLVEAGGSIPAELSAYLGDIQPAYSTAPEYQAVHGVYNHGWLIGDEKAIPLATQAELDSLLEISPRQQGASPEASVLKPE